MSDKLTKQDKKSAGWMLSLLISAVIVAVAGGLAALTFTTEPTAEKGGATKKTAMLVEVVDVERGDWRPRIVATGTVEPSQDIVLRPQVGGRVTELAPAFTPGGFVEEGELLIQIEAADYRHAVAQRKSELREALSELSVERGRQDAAQAEYDYLDEELAPENEALVLRQPQLDAIQQQVGAARAAVEQAELDLRRTAVRAPFDAHILGRDTNVGSQVSPTESIGRLVGVEEYWVGVELPLSKLRWVQTPDQDDEGSRVRVRNRQAWPEDSFRSGRLFRLVGALDPDTRTAQLLASIPDPLAREADHQDKPPLMIGEYVEVAIEGKPLEDVVRIDRDYVRDGDTIWVMEDDKLQIRQAEISMRDAEYAYVSSGLEDGEQVVTTHLSTVVDEAPLRLDGQGDEGSDQEAPEEEPSDE
ncbi:MAG: efflux RND transporter periplasmic adaptor subunit [Persicimonas sp.]